VLSRKPIHQFNITTTSVNEIVEPVLVELIMI